jgi:hypothetical protein
VSLNTASCLKLIAHPEVTKKTLEQALNSTHVSHHPLTDKIKKQCAWKISEKIALYCPEEPVNASLKG